jgi:protein-tyrosine phosphatase
MIDLHCHLLPALDDGPKLIEESVAMARLAAEKGVRAIAATPHVLESQAVTMTRARIEQTLTQVRERLQAEGLQLELHLGAEYFLSMDFPHLVQKHFPLASLNGTRYVLIELPITHLPPFLEYSSFRTGLEDEELAREIPFLRPILAHPERYLEVGRSIQTAERFRALGYLLQINLGSFAGIYGRGVRKTAEKMVQAGLADFVATDAHSASSLKEILEDGTKRLCKVAGEKKAQVLLEENPGRVLQGQPLESLEDYQ